jgi:hypothetical protein
MLYPVSDGFVDFDGSTWFYEIAFSHFFPEDNAT